MSEVEASSCQILLHPFEALAVMERCTAPTDCALSLVCISSKYGCHYRMDGRQGLGARMKHLCFSSPSGFLGEQAQRGSVRTGAYDGNWEGGSLVPSNRP